MSRQSLERTLPHNVDAEKSVLGSILVNNEHYYRVIESLRPEDFYLDAHRVIFRQMIELMEQSKVIDLITIQDELVRASQLESAGGITYLAGLLDGIPHLVNIEHYIQIIRERSCRAGAFQPVGKANQDGLRFGERNGASRDEASRKALHRTRNDYGNPDGIP
jgi:replicative DNA helicase